MTSDQQAPDPDQQSPRLDPAPDVVAEIDRLVSVSRAAPQDGGSNVAMWRAIFGLEKWLFIARGAQDAPSPYAVTLPEGPMLLAFTTAQRARSAGVANGLSDEEASMILAIPLPGAIEWAASFAESGITGLVVDAGVSDAFTPLRNLVPMRDWFAANPA